jgi:threonine dehydrogenase-like Zn-dependent dehydrogenase
VTTARMPAVVHYALQAGGVELRDVPVPVAGPGEVLVRVRGVSVCGSDVHQYHNTQSWAVNVPVVLGHEFCGEVAEVGLGVAGFAPGDRVASETAAEIDPDSPQTRAGQYNLDPRRRGFGYGIDGAMARSVRVPARCLHRLPGRLPFEVAALTEPCCVAYQAVVVNSRVRPGDVVAVIGPGPIGLLCAQVARMCGAEAVVLAGLARDRPRLELGRRMGATHAVETEAQDLTETMRSLGDGQGADLVVDAAGASAALRQALAAVRPGGHVTKVGWGPQPLGFSLDPLVQKAVTLQGSFSHTWAVWERVLRLLDSGQLDPRPLVSRVAPLSEWQACFDGMAEGALVKAVLVP